MAGPQAKREPLVIPGELVTFSKWAIGIAVAAFAAGAGSTRLVFPHQINSINEQLRTINYRLCRLERASRLEPWMTCEGARPTAPAAQASAAQ